MRLIKTLGLLVAVVATLTLTVASEASAECPCYTGATISFGTINFGESKIAETDLIPSVAVNVGQLTTEATFAVFTVPAGEDHCSNVNNLTPPATCAFSVKYTPHEKCENITGLLKIPLEVVATHEKKTEWHYLHGHSRGCAFEAGEYPTTISGAQTTTNVFTVQGQKVECKKVTATAELTGGAHSLSLSPTYSECSAFGFISAEVQTNGCTYKFSTTGTKSGGTADEYEGGMQIVCPEGKEMTVVASTCTVHVPPQTPTTNKVDYKTETGSPDKILVTSTIEGIHSATTDGFLCPLEASKSTDTSGKYTGTMLLSGSGGIGVHMGMDE